MNGIAALSRLVRQLPADFPAPLFIAQHVSPASRGWLPRILSRAGPLPAEHPRDLEPIEAGHIYVAPPDHHLLVGKGYIRLSQGPRENHVRPAIDPLFRSAALSYGNAVVGVVLTGELNDGTAGLIAIKDRGGVAIIQDPLEAASPSMPRSALAHVKADYCCRLDDMAEVLMRLAADDPEPGDCGLDELMAIECRIAADVSGSEDWRRLRELGAPTDLNCPVCQCELYQLPDKRMPRLRCRAGHAFTAQTLLAETGSGMVPPSARSA
nr:chemotaxis protein CheB [Cupriavidus numazuensis]